LSIYFLYFKNIWSAKARHLIMLILPEDGEDKIAALDPPRAKKKIIVESGAEIIRRPATREKNSK
jgi:hypothetical protein